MKASFYTGNRTFEMDEGTMTSPQQGQVQIKVSHCGVCGTDYHIFQGHMDQRVSIPQIIGHEMSGTIQSVGEGVTGIQVGDRVVVRPLDSCGTCPACQAGHQHICQNLKFLGIDTPGAMQGFWTVPASTIHHLPDAVSLEHGAVIEPLAVACHDVKRGRVEAGEYCVVIGGGPIGLLIGLVAQQKGAHVYISEINSYRLELAQSLGLNVLNPQKEDIVAKIEKETNSAGADVVFEVSGSGIGAETMTQLPRTRGRIVMVAIHAQPQSVDLFRFFWRELELVGARVYEADDFEEAIALAEAQKIPFDRIITEIEPLDRVQNVFENMTKNPEAMKSLIQCGN